MKAHCELQQKNYIAYVLLYSMIYIYIIIYIYVIICIYLSLYIYVYIYNIYIDYVIYRHSVSGKRVNWLNLQSERQG
jgi:hypothetical protein